MKRKLKTSLWICLTIVITSQAVASKLVIDSKANIYGAGHSISPDPGGGGGGLLPPVYHLTPGTGQAIIFSQITGLVSSYYDVLYAGPEGYIASYINMDIYSYGGVSGIKHTGKRMFVAGVFLDDSEPANPPPPTLNFSNADNFTELSPLLNQVFFIGDGKNNSGVTQQFHVPETATRLFLGFADAPYFQGYPGAYDDNRGSMDAYFEVIPEPGTVALLAVGGMAVLRRRRK